MRKTLVLVLLIILSVPLSGQDAKKTAIVKVNSIDMYYEVYGNGEPLLLLHGWTQSSGFWSDYIPTFARHYTVYAIDLRGHGRTSQLSSDFSIAKASADVLALMDHLKINKVKAIGLSYGGLVLLQLAGLHPDRVASMVLIGASHSFKGGENNNKDNAFSYENLPASFIDKLKEIHPQGESQIKAMFNPNLNYQISLTDKALRMINAKVLIVHGDRDEILGVAPAIALHKKLPNSALWILPNTGHIPIGDSNKDLFLKRSIHFLSDE